MESRVSICIPTYNGREHLKECLDSVRAQSFKDFEVVICDDQSSDGTLDFARELANGDKRFRFIQNPRRFGLVGNWNNCIAASRGEWIKFVFQDDIIAPTCVEKLLQACRQSGTSFAFCARDFIFEEGVSALFRQWMNANQARIDAIYFKKSLITADEASQIVLQNLGYNIIGEPTSTLIQRSVFEMVGLFDDAMIQLCDAEFWFRIMSNFGVSWVPERLAIFRLHAKATTSTNYDLKKFRIEVLDPLVIIYRFAFDGRFSRLRAAKSPGKFPYLLRMRCAVAAYRAWQKAKRTPESGSNPTMNRMAEWNAVTLSCPGLRWLARIGGTIELCCFAKRIAHKLVRTCGFGLSD